MRSWNNYLLPLIMLNSDANYPWPLGIMVYKGEFSSEWQLVLAFVTLTILPAVMVFFVAQSNRRGADRRRGQRDDGTDGVDSCRRLDSASSVAGSSARPI